MDCAVASKAGATDSGHLTIVISISDGCKRVGICSPGSGGSVQMSLGSDFSLA